MSVSDLQVLKANIVVVGPSPILALAELEAFRSKVGGEVVIAGGILDPGLPEGVTQTVTCPQ